jgi:hypothetical protein
MGEGLGARILGWARLWVRASYVPSFANGAKDGAPGHPQRRDTGVSPLRRGSAPPAVEMTSVFG